MKRAFILFSLIILFSSCTVKQEIFLHRDGGGTLHMELQMHDMVISYAEDIYGGFSADTGTMSMFDTEVIRKFFFMNPSTELTSLENPTPGALSLGLRFRDPETLFDQESYDLQPVLTVTEEGGITKVKFTLTPENLRILTDPVSLTGTDLIDVFGPQSDRPYTDEEYYDLVSYAFEEYLAGKPAKEILSGAVIDVTVRTDGEIVDITGGTLEDGAAVFRIPFMYIVTMARPLVLSVSYR